MGIGIRSFLVEDDGCVERVPWARMSRLFQGEENGCFRRRAGTRVRCAIVFLEYRDRRPTQVLRTEFSVLYFDEDGRLDSEAHGQQLRLIGQSLEAIAHASNAGKIVDIRPYLARKQYREKFEWTPTEDELETIFRQCL